MTAGDEATRLLRLLPPERAHRVGLGLAGFVPGRVAAACRDPRLAVHALGLDFPNPIGLAAGLDKGATAPDAMLRLGFGSVEVGTVTPLPQPGNPLPRLFRLRRHGALINRLGFNSEGQEAVADRLEDRAARTRGRQSGILGVNIGANKESDDRVFDYVAGVRLFAPLASYLTVNVSSPNTPGLRDLQLRESLSALLVRLTDARAAAAEECGRRTPLLLKVAPDLSDSDLGGIVETVLQNGIDGIIISNTTVTRPGLDGIRHAGEAGGLSGRPLFDLSTAMLGRARQLAGPNLVLVGAGGVDSAATAWSKFAAGADLVQLYTGLVYRGPSLPRKICEGLLQRLDDRNFTRIGQVRDIEVNRWAAAWSRAD